MSVLPESQKRALAVMGEAFGDRTRRDLYRIVLEAVEPVSAAEASALAGVHRTVARAHLERLVDLDLVRVSSRHGPGCGRPAKVYLPGAGVPTANLPPRRHELVGELLVRALARTAVDERRVLEIAETVGWEYGRAAAEERLGAVGKQWEARRGEGLSPAAAELWLDEQGYLATVKSNGAVSVLLRNCVFRELAATEPAVVCALDLGILRGLFALPAGALRRLSSAVAGEAACRLEFTPAPAS